MSKKKNTLSDLEEFLKSQASTLVQPPAVEGMPEPSEAAPIKQPIAAQQPVPSRMSLENEFFELFAKDRPAWYRLVLKACEQGLHDNPKLALLINTTMYVQHGSDWKTAIERYWSAKNG